ncbi:MAG: ferredoxin, partial [Pseudomonadota bacterium]
MTPPLEDRLTALLALRGLQPLGAFAPTDDDDLSGIKSVVMIAPAPDFWTQFTASHEWQGGLPDPMDRWSQRVIGRLALELDAKAYFPFTGPPYRPFYSWAQRAGQSHASPVTLLISAA